MSLLRRSGLGAACACVLGAAGVASAETGPVTVTPLPPANGFSAALGIGNSGVVVGQMRPSNPGPQPVPGYWTDGVFHALPGLPGASPGFNSGAFAINDAGVIVGFAAFPENGDPFPARAVKWVNGAPVELQSLPGQTLGQARAVNAAGQVAGRADVGIFRVPTAVRWDADGTAHALSRLAVRDPRVVEFYGYQEHDANFAYAINAAGRVVGYSALGGYTGDTPLERAAVYWDDGDPAAHALPVPIGFNDGSAVSISDGGRIAGTIATHDFYFGYTDARAAVWDDATQAPRLLPLPDSAFETGAIYTFATAANALGQVIGGGALDAQSAFQYQSPVTSNLLWNPDGSVVDLTPSLADAFPGFSRFTLTGINDAGLISGYATTSDFHMQIPFVVSVPEPAALPLLALGGLVLRRSRRAGRTAGVGLS